MMHRSVKIDSGFVIIEITNACNFSCPFCFNNSGHGRSANMQISDFESIIKGMNTDSVNCVGISGGEPYMHPEVDTILRYVINAGFRLRVVSNGSLIDRKRLDFILNTNSILQLSLDGIDADTNDSMRNKGSFKCVVELLNSLHSENYKNGILRMTITKSNYKQIFEYYLLAMSYGFYPSYSIVQPFGLAPQSWENLALNDSEYETVIEQMVRLTKMNPGMKQQLKNVKPIFFCPIEYGDAILLKPIVDVCGNVYPCHSLMKERYSLGNCFHKQFTDIINTADPIAITNLKTDHKLRMKEKCDICVLYKLEKCKMGCPAVEMASDCKLINHNCSKKIERIINSYMED